MAGRMSNGKKIGWACLAWIVRIVPLLFAVQTQAQVVINEIFYHAPEDISDLQWIELYNHSDQQINLGGWSIAKGLKYKFPANTTVEPHDYLIICKNGKRFQEYYKAKVVGEFDKNLKRSGEQLELRNGTGVVVDSVVFGDHALPICQP